MPVLPPSTIQQLNAQNLEDHNRRIWDKYQRQIQEAMLQPPPYVTQSGAFGMASDAYADNDLRNESYRKKMIGMRLRLTNAMVWPFEHISTALSGDTVYCFVVSKGKPAVLEDAADMFPSDTLITQLRLIQE